MSAGKKVFTRAGDLIAKFLKENKNTDQVNESKFLAIGGADITFKETTSFYEDLTSFKNITRDQVIQQVSEKVKNQIKLNLLNFDGKDGDHSAMINSNLFVQTFFQENQDNIVQILSQLDQLEEFTIDAVGDLIYQSKLFKTQLKRYINTLTQRLDSLHTKKLDYFVGSAEDHNQVYFKTKDNGLFVKNGNPDTPKDLLVMNVGMTGEQVNSELIIGGSRGTATPDFDTIVLSRNVVGDGDIEIKEGKHFVGTSMKSRFADVAEYYSTNDSYPAGTLMELTSEKNPTDCDEAKVVEYMAKSDSPIMGIVSDKPGLLINETYKDKYPFVVPLVLTGRSPVLVHGAIDKGNHIIPSTTMNGICQAVTKEQLRVEMNKDPLLKPLGIIIERPKENTVYKMGHVTIHRLECKIG